MALRLLSRRVGSYSSQIYLIQRSLSKSQRAVVTAAATVMVGATLFPPRVVHAEAPLDDLVRTGGPE
jgi:hypothetical protein